jgi:hypothetical protein
MLAPGCLQASSYAGLIWGEGSHVDDTSWRVCMLAGIWDTEDCAGIKGGPGGAAPLAGAAALTGCRYPRGRPSPSGENILHESLDSILPSTPPSLRNLLNPDIFHPPVPWVAKMIAATLPGGWQNPWKGGWRKAALLEMAEMVNHYNMAAIPTPHSFPAPTSHMLSMDAPP